MSRRKIIVMDLVIQMTNDWKFQFGMTSGLVLTGCILKIQIEKLLELIRTSNKFSTSPVVLQVSSAKIFNVHNRVADHESIVHHPYDLDLEKEPGNVFSKFENVLRKCPARILTRSRNFFASVVSRTAQVLDSDAVESSKWLFFSYLVIQRSCQRLSARDQCRSYHEFRLPFAFASVHILDCFLWRFHVVLSQQKSLRTVGKRWKITQ